MKVKLIVGNKEYERDGISAGDYEEFTEIRDQVNPDGDYKKGDIELICKALQVAFSNQIPMEDLKKTDATELIYHFMAVDAIIASDLKKKIDKLKADFGEGE